MDLVGVSLATVSVVLFAVTLGLSTRPSQGLHIPKRRLNTSTDLNQANDQKTIVVKLPQGVNVPEDYTIDLKVSLFKAKKEGEEEKGNKTKEQGKKYYRRLDEYL